MDKLTVVTLCGVLAAFVAGAGEVAETSPAVGVPLRGAEAVEFLTRAEIVGEPEAFDEAAITGPVRVTLTDGKHHAVDSSAVAFEIAAKAAYRQSVPKAGVQLLEPIMKLDVFTPDDNVGDVIGDLNRRRGMIQAQDQAPTGVRIKAEAPLGEMFGYIGDLRTMTSGRGQFSMEFSHYAGAPKGITEAVIKKVEELKAEKAK